MTYPGKTSTAWVAGLLIVAVLALSVPILAYPRPAHAQAACIAALASALGISLGSGAAAAAASLLVVPVLDAMNLSQNAITANATAALKTKSCADELLTAALKIAINLVRDMVIRWIITGRFEGPVFSASFAVDLQRSMENASRIYLSKLTGINFCAGIQIPPSAFLNLNINLALACTFNGDRNLFRLGAGVSDVIQLSASEETPNEYWNAAVAALDQKLQFEEQARSSFTKDYETGQGFLCIRDANGRCTTPGSAVAALVMQTQVISPIRQTDVANTVQQAIAAILDTAIRVLLERGLGRAFGS
jgi:hypothetical protein